MGGNISTCTGKTQRQRTPSGSSSTRDDVSSSEPESRRSSDASTGLVLATGTLGAYSHPTPTAPDQSPMASSSRYLDFAAPHHFELDEGGYFRGVFDFEWTAKQEASKPKETKKPKTFGQTRRALSPRPEPSKFCLGPRTIRGENAVEYCLNGSPNKNLARSIAGHVQRQLGERAIVSLTPSGALQIEGTDGPVSYESDLCLTLERIQKLRIFGLSDNQIARLLDSAYLSARLLNNNRGPCYASFTSFECISELAAVGLYDLAASSWHYHMLQYNRSVTGIEDGWRPGNPWVDKTEARLRKRLQRYGITCEPEEKTCIHRVKELFCLVLLRRRKPDPMQACMIVSHDLHHMPRGGKILNYQWKAMKELCDLVTTPEDAKRFKDRLSKGYSGGGLIDEWFGPLDRAASDLRERMEYTKFVEALDGLSASDSVIFHFVNEEEKTLLDVKERKPQAVRIEPKKPGSIGHLDPETVKNLRILAEKGILIAGQLETALGAFRLFCRDASADGHMKKLQEAFSLRHELLVATKNEEIQKRIEEIFEAARDEFKV